MHPGKSVFAIGDDDSEQEEDLLAAGARRLGALAAGVSVHLDASPEMAQEALKSGSPAATSSPSKEGAPPCSWVYRPETDGPPIIGIFVVAKAALRRPEVLFAHQQAPCNCLPLHSHDLARYTERSVWRGHSQAAEQGNFPWNLNSGSTRLLQWIERFALPEELPSGCGSLLQGESVDGLTGGFLGSGGQAAADMRLSSHLFFTVPMEKSSCSLFGVSCYSARRERLWEVSAPESSEGLCAVCVVARIPFWGLLLFRLLPVSAAFFELMETASGGGRSTAESSSGLPTQVLLQLYDQLNTVNFHLLRYTEITFNLEGGLPPFIMAMNPRAFLTDFDRRGWEAQSLHCKGCCSPCALLRTEQLLVLVKALLLESKILFFSRDASKASTAVLSLISLLPGGLACGFSSDGFGEHEYRWKRHGLPFRIFDSRSAFFPLLPLELVDDLLLQKRGFLIATTNRAVATHPVGKPDITGKTHTHAVHTQALRRMQCRRFVPLCVARCSFAALFDVDALEVAIQNHLLVPLLQLTAWEEHFAQRIARETAFLGSQSLDGQTPNSSSLSKHATDLLQQTISTLASHAAAHGLPFLKGKDEAGGSPSRGAALTDFSQAVSPPSGGGGSSSRTDFLQQQKQGDALPADGTSGGSGWLSSRIRWTWERSGSSRSTSDATAPPSLFDPNWEAHADLIRAAFSQHLEQLCRKAALAAGAGHSRQQLLRVLQQEQQRAATAANSEGLSVLGAEWLTAWTETYNFQAWLQEHRLPSEEAAPAKHETLQSPPTSGYARYFYSNGDCYEGQFAASLRHGDGIYSSADGMRYDGSWFCDERHGHGVLAHEAAGYLYVGQWQHNKKSGEGHLYSQKERYWGQFYDNKYHGKGRYVQRDGLEYEGEFAKGRFEGLGKLTISQSGSGRNSLRNYRKGVVIRGGFEGGKVSGTVTAVYADGRTYTGGLSPESLLPDGSGSMLYADCCAYDGQWRGGLRHGAGVLSIPVGVLQGSGTKGGPVEDTQETHAGAATLEGEVVMMDGQWLDDKPAPDAEWSVTFPNGDKYLGRLKFPNAKVPIGEDAPMATDVREERREEHPHTSPEGRRKHCQNIVPHGWGLCKLKASGEVYEGQWMDGMRHGKGESITHSGARHCGQWRFGHPHGTGHHIDATSSCTPEGAFRYEQFAGEDSPGIVLEEEHCTEPPPNIPKVVFEAFYAFPLKNCPLVEPPPTPLRSSSSVSPSHTPRD
ncbi:MORN repeat-containing protein [Cyclospora cayetanensis]|uniref:MORN repeat-containing protein n=1 Tax=Cyclospora cayetanensis TaxID=88456 RepID=A0A1D3D9M9_9EIME|nr:MORN repeat-containing protein [Cyclospora cayetanensis]